VRLLLFIVLSILLPLLLSMRCVATDAKLHFHERSCGTGGARNLGVDALPNGRFGAMSFEKSSAAFGRSKTFG